LNIRSMDSQDLKETSLVHKEAFERQCHSHAWLECNVNAYPRALCFVAVINNAIVGYIIWSQKSGFRRETVLELEQIAVLKNHQNQGVGRNLIVSSLSEVRNKLSNQDSLLKHIMVTTRADNDAQKLYKDTLGAEIEATITNLYSADEVVMVARNV